MKKKKKKTKGAMPKLTECCQIEAVVTVDKRGQIVLPKKLRQVVGIKAGDKLAVLSMGLEKSYCLLLTKVNKASNMFMVKVIADLDKTKAD